MVFVELTAAAIQGVAQVLTERFLQRRENSVTIRSVVEEVEAIKQIQASDRELLTELKHLLVQVFERVDGLEVRRSKVVFTPTEHTPDVNAAMLNLDLEISKLRSHRPAAEPAATAAADPSSRAADPSSIYYQLDEEISRLRRGTEGSR